MLGIIGKTQMLIGMRLHALILPQASEYPWWEWCTNPRLKVYAVYQPGIGGHVNSLELEHMKKIVDETWENREAIKKSWKKHCGS